MKLNPSQSAMAIKICIEAGVNLMQWGDSGIGKSAIPRQVVKQIEKEILAKENYLYHTESVIRNAVDTDQFSVRFKDLRMAQCDISEWGLPRVMDEVLVDGQYQLMHPDIAASQGLTAVDQVHISTRPEWWPRHDFPGLFIIFMDEVNRGDKWALNGAMQICAEHHLRNRPAPPGTRLLSACNPSYGDFIVEDLGTAMKARWAHIEVETNSRVFVENRSQYLDEISINLLYDSKKNTLVKPNPDAKDNGDWSIEDQIEWRPRTWEQHALLSKYIAWQNERDPNWAIDNRDTLRAIMIGTIGRVNQSLWWKAFESGTYISLRRLLSGEVDYDQVKKLGADKLAMMSLMIKSGMTDSALVNEDTRRAERVRADRFIDFFSKLQEERKELASMITQHFRQQFGTPDFKIMTRLLSTDQNFLEFSRELQEAAEDEEL